MNTNIVISLDSRRAKKDGTFPLVMRLGHNERTTSILIGISIHEKDWDAKNRIIRKSYSGVSSVSRLNNLLAKKKSEAMDVILKLNEAGQLANMPIAVLRKHIVSNNDSSSFFNFTQGLIDELLKANQIGTARSYKGVADVLRKYLKGKDLQFEEITYDFLCKFETFHLSKGNSYNGLSVYIRAVRAIYNKAMKSGLVDKALYPFTDYKIKSVPTQKRALDWDVLKKIIELDLPPAHQCFHARNYFVASYMMYGMNFMDMAYIKREDIKSGRIQYRRRKTSKLYDIKINDFLQGIFNFYSELNTSSQYIFPIIKRDTALFQSRDIQCARKQYNKKLKLVAGLCGIEENLTSYVSRHSFATQAMMKEVPIKVISTMLGHSDLKTTEIYLKSLPSNVLDDYNDKILMDS